MPADHGFAAIQVFGDLRDGEAFGVELVDFDAHELRADGGKFYS